jgi:hypothetical protein
MSTLVTLRTTDGRIIQGISFSVTAANLPSSVTALAAGMPGGLNQGVYHIRTSHGWEYIPANQIVSVAVKAGVAL